MTDQLSRELLGLLRKQSMKRIHSNESSLVQGQVQLSWSNAVRLSGSETKPIPSNPCRRRYKILIFIENIKIYVVSEKKGMLILYLLNQLALCIYGRKTFAKTKIMLSFIGIDFPTSNAAINLMICLPIPTERGYSRSTIQSSPEYVEQVVFCSSPVQIHLNWIGFSVRRTDPFHFILCPKSPSSLQVTYQSSAKTKFRNLGDWSHLKGHGLT